MTNIISFRVVGEPAPKGSKRHVGNGRMIESSKKLPAWMRSVKQEAAKNRPSEPIDAPVSVYMHFYLPRPKRPRYDAPAVKPDVDKLARAILDSLEAAGVLTNDSRVTLLRAIKHYATDTTPPGAEITIHWKETQ
ncbi:RusA family crossover junction endodeoxyribonuclease [Corynebacterium sp. YSMAA1_1_D6]|uniref:RusA family crossover junction endodeoxyribonuclease n=1 Tax=Corynebacterium sp. YSMAA1_1_D6 TaxID=3383589 RepID=UPI0038D06EF0